MGTLLNFIRLTLGNPSEGLNRLLYPKEYNKGYGALGGTFIKQEYYELYSAIRPHTTLLDLGGAIGDTAIYFAMHPDVYRVITYESSPKSFRELRWNVSYSRLRDKIECRNEALTADGGYVSNSHAKASGANKVSAAERGVKAVTLKSVLQKTGGPVAIKCDIEGSEKGLFDCDLSRVYAIELEYHEGLRGGMAATLRKAGFSVRVISGNKRQGIIFAKRQLKK